MQTPAELYCTYKDAGLIHTEWKRPRTVPGFAAAVAPEEIEEFRYHFSRMLREDMRREYDCMRQQQAVLEQRGRDLATIRREIAAEKQKAQADLKEARDTRAEATRLAASVKETRKELKKELAAAQAERKALETEKASIRNRVREQEARAEKAEADALAQRTRHEIEARAVAMELHQTRERASRFRDGMVRLAKRLHVGEGDDDCIICHESPDQTIRLVWCLGTCGHLLCHRCADRVVTCPVCQQDGFSTWTQYEK